jgi:hypothetical protein
MRSFVFRVLDVGAVGVWLASTVKAISGETFTGFTFISGLMTLAGLIQIIVVRTYLPMKRDRREAESHILDMEEQRLVNRKHEMDIEDEMNEITVFYEKDK